MDTLLSAVCVSILFFAVPVSGELPSWSASSEFEAPESHSADRADINTRETADAAGAWIAGTNDQDQWLMRDLGDVSVITGVITKGRNYSPDWPYAGPHDQYVTSYVISYGNENGDEAFYTDADGQVTVFQANDDRDTEVYNDFGDFSGRITARFVKIHPQTWHDYISMRAKIVTDATQQTTEIPTTAGPLYTTEQNESTLPGTTVSQHSSSQTTQRPTLPGTTGSQQSTRQTAHRPTLPGTTVASQQTTDQTIQRSTLPGTTVVSQHTTNQTTSLAGGETAKSIGTWYNKSLNVALVCVFCAAAIMGMGGALLYYWGNRRQRRQQVAQDPRDEEFTH
ncbi:hypothetical protein Bbelb_289170 [Branchiostoma belcheri]|nr:hypothetical protein Bbelb_289170 [Branchiostoma belcheri]